MLFTVMVFVVDKFPASFSLALSFLVLRLTAGIPPRGIRFAKPLAMLAAFIIIMQILLGPGENYIVKPLFPPWFPLVGGMGSLKWDGLFLGLTICCRLAALTLLLPMLTLTTAPREIAAGLSFLGFNYRTAFIITTAFNLIPLFQEEGRLIMDAQKLRGVRSFDRRSFERRSFERSSKDRSSFKGGSFMGKLKAYPSLVVPLMLGAMRRARSASIAMDARAFGVYKTRTWLDRPVMNRLDYLSITVCVIFSVGLVLLNFFLD
jgi:energy-coupling factor transport system permease protein